jgi:small subunit ribosomal protein S20
MAITKGAKKAIRVQARRRAINERRKKAFKSAEKNLRKIVSTGKRAVAEGLLSGAYKAIDKAAKRGIIKKNTAARKKSRLAKAIKKIAGK